MSAEFERQRLVVMGDAGVGKTAILKRFLFNTFNEKYRATVEDLYSKDFHLSLVTVKVDFIDTCGQEQFPAMRRLSIATANAFLLVCSAASYESFDSMKRCFDAIREQRKDFQTIPMVIAYNKIDLDKDRIKLDFADVSNWLHCETPKLKAKLLQCSAKENNKIKEIFMQFVQLSRILQNPDLVDSSRFKRRSSSYVSTKRNNENATNSGSASSSTTKKSPAKPRPLTTITVSEPPPENDKELSSYLVTDSENKRRGTSGGSNYSSSLSIVETGITMKDAKPTRSQSLIRRCSRKSKNEDRDGNADNCVIS